MPSVQLLTRQLRAQSRLSEVDDRVRLIVGAWVADYKTASPHFSRGYKTGAYAAISPQPATTLRRSKAPRAGRLLKPRRKASQLPRP
jgi:hypothetical protein